MIGLFLFFVVLILIIIISGNNKQKKRQNEVKSAIMKVESAFELGEITQTHKDILLKKIKEDWQWLFDIDKKIQSFKLLKVRQTVLIQKYGYEIGGQLLNHQYWVGMSEQMLLDCKGNPDKIEREVLKTKTKTTYIYGNKSSGDYFVL